MKKTKTENKSSAKKKTTKIQSFLPSPDQLVQKEFTVKVTLLLNKSTIDYFKNEAAKHKVCYQAMIRNLLDEYVRHYK